MQGSSERLLSSGERRFTLSGVTVPVADVAQAEEAARVARTEWRTSQLLSAAAHLMGRRGFAGVSVQAIAEEAGVSVGLVYRYFGRKDDLLLAVIVNVLDAFAVRVPEAMDAAGEDPVERVATGFRAYCEVINEQRHAAMLTYRESRALSSEARDRIKNREVQTTEPLRAAVAAAIASGVFRTVDVDLVAYDLLLLAHSWALKHWHFEQSLDLESYVARQTSLFLNALLEPRQRRKYRHLLEVEP